MSGARPRFRLHHLLRDAAALHGGAPAVTYRDETRTYADVWRATQSAARGLQTLGVEPGERVAIFLEKRHEVVVSVMAASAVDAVFVPVNPVLRSGQVSHILRDCGVSVLITSSARLGQLRDEIRVLPALRAVVLVDDNAEPLDNVDLVGWAAMDPPAPAEPAASADPAVTAADTSGRTDQDVAAIFYTSGSTGLPKGVVLSHRNLLVGAESVSSYLGNTADDVLLAVLPLSFDAGFSQVTTAFAVGAHVVLHNHVMAADVVRLCERHSVTGLTCVPPLWVQLVERAWPAEATRNLRYFANTGGRMPASVLAQLRRLFPQAKPYLMYGLTEAFRSTFLDPDEVDRRPDSIGKAIPNAEVLVLRPDGTQCAPGEPGELVHRGPLVALGYWNDEERTAARFRPYRRPGVPLPEIAVWSGDTVVRDEEGFLYFVGRTDEMIKSSGYRVSPTEIEEACYSSGLVSDAVALGVPDDRLGQRIVLVVASGVSAGALESPPQGDSRLADTLLSHLRKSLPLYMVPSEVVVRRELPRSPNGKYDRASIRDSLLTPSAGGDR